MVDKQKCVNPFVPNAPFLYPLKISENRKDFLVFSGGKKGYIANKWVKPYFWVRVYYC